MPRRFAENTAVPISQSRNAIDRLLREWGADGVQWTDEFNEGRVTLRFVWRYMDRKLRAKLVFQLEPDEKLRQQARGPRGFSDVKYRKLQEGRGKREHRVLLLWLKAAFNAIELGMTQPEVLFLPWLEDGSGVTVAERIMPSMMSLPDFPLRDLLALPEGHLSDE